MNALLRRIAIVIVAVTVSAGSGLRQSRSSSDLTRAGWDALKTGRLQDAAAAFGEVLKRAPAPDALLGSALVAHLQTRYEDARQHLVAALAIDPSLIPASLLLGEVLYRSGDLDGAILTYEQALVRTPDHPQMLKKLEAWRKELALHSRFGQRFSDHFTVLFEGPSEAALAERAVKILEAAYWRIGTALYSYPQDVVTVVLYTREQFRDITQSPEWAGGAFDGRIRVPVQGALQKIAEFERVLSHEFTHALVYSLAPRGVPTWLNEGLAVLFEGTDLTRMRRQIRASERIPLDQMERPFAKLSPRDARLAYAESAVAAAMLMDHSGASSVVNLLTDIGNNVPFTEAFERHALMSYAEFQKKLRGESP